MTARHTAFGFGLALAGCTGISVQQHAEPELAMLRQAGYRVAVMPFLVSAPEDGFLSESLAPVGELFALEQGRERAMHDQLGELLRGDVVAWLRQSDFEVLDPWHVATELAHAGVTAAQAQDPGRVREVAARLGVDGLVYGDVRRWNRSYYVLQSVVDVALHLELVDAGTGRQLFRTDRAEQIGSGLTGGPTGYASVATEPVAGLRGSQLRSLTRSVARHAVADLNGGELGDQLGPATPRLAIVALAREHGGAFTAGERVDVLAIGSPDCHVCFDIGSLRTEVPMRQTERHSDSRGDRASYVGHYVVDPADVGDELPLTCTIQRGATRRLVATRYRWDGSVALDGAGAGL